MKLSRRIRRSWLRYFPEWMRCFARSVIKGIKLQSIKAIKGIKQAGRQIGEVGNYLNSAFSSQL